MTPEVEALLRTLPRRIKVGAYDWRLVLHEGVSGDFGETDYELNRINLWPDAFVDPIHCVGVVVHELLHTIYDDRGLDVEEENREEQIVLGFETGIIALYRDNPRLLTWIKRGLRNAVYQRN